MSKLFVIKEQIKKIFNAYSMFIVPALKFILTIVSLTIINSKIGYYGLLNNIAVVILISLACMFLPVSGITVVVSLTIIGNLYGLSMYASISALVVFVVMYLFFFRFSPKQGILILAVPVLFIMKIPYVVPIVSGLIYSPIAVLPVTMGLFIYFMISTVSGNSAELLAKAANDPIGIVKGMIVDSAKDEAFIVTFIAFAAVIISVYIIRRLSIDYSHYIAIGVGSALNIVVMLVGYLKFDMDSHVSIAGIFIGGIFSLVLAVIIDFFVLTVDYSRTEFVQFEDDDYYYYVKAVPKINVTAPEVTVKRINAQKVKKQKQTVRR